MIKTQNSDFVAINKKLFGIACYCQRNAIIELPEICCCSNWLTSKFTTK